MPLELIKMDILEKESVLGLDAGAVFVDREAYGLGNLVCYDLDSHELIVQPNLERTRLGLTS
jgi:hypothetical protein